MSSLRVLEPELKQRAVFIISQERVSALALAWVLGGSDHCFQENGSKVKDLRQ